MYRLRNNVTYFTLDVSRDIEVLKENCVEIVENLDKELSNSNFYLKLLSREFFFFKPVTYNYPLAVSPQI